MSGTVTMEWNEANTDEVMEKLAYWQRLLCLEHWRIVAVREEPQDCRDSGGEMCAGTSTAQHVLKAAVIRLASVPEASARAMGALVRVCLEKTLVHELLHLKYNYIGNFSTYEGKIADVLEHQRLEEMARALVCARYGHMPDWFAGEG